MKKSKKSRTSSGTWEKFCENVFGDKDKLDKLLAVDPTQSLMNFRKAVEGIVPSPRLNDGEIKKLKTIFTPTDPADPDPQPSGTIDGREFLEWFSKTVHRPAAVRRKKGILATGGDPPPPPWRS